MAPATIRRGGRVIFTYVCKKRGVDQQPDGKFVPRSTNNAVRLAGNHVITTCATMAAILLFVGLTIGGFGYDLLRRYADALGGSLKVEVTVGDETYQIA